MREPLRPPVRTVLFVCEGNTFRSVLAAATFNHAAPPGWTAESAGLSAGVATSPAALELLRSIGIEDRPPPPRTVSSKQLEAADRVILFFDRARLPGSRRMPVEEWSVPGGLGKTDAEREGIRDDIRARVEWLVARLAKG